MKDHLRDLLSPAIQKTAAGGEASVTDLPPLLLEPPKQKEFGDVSTNIAMLLTKLLRKPPRSIAEAILKNLEDPEGIITRAEIAGPGFINFTFSARFLYDRLREVAAGKKEKIDLGKGKKVQVEFASVNPTGPLHVGHGRVAVIGDVLARLLLEVGYDVEREYYINDAGRQMELLGLSIGARYRELCGQEAPLPEEGYPGAYVTDVAQKLREQFGDRYLADDNTAFFRQYGCEAMLAMIRDDLGKFGICFDRFFSETELRAKGEVERTLNLLRARGLIYENEGAQWFRSTAYGDDKDRPIIKSDGDLTYFATDIAYHRNKFERGFDRLVNVWGADHHGYVGRLKAAVQALDQDPENLRVVLVQMVNLTRGGQPVRMGKRLGEFITLREVLEEVGKDAARFFFLMRKSDTHLEFDLELAKKESSENPVYYIQYAHARISSIFEQAHQKGLAVDAEVLKHAEVERLQSQEELDLIKLVALFREILEESVKELEPHRIVFYLLELAGEFHRYYNRFRVISEDESLTRARLLLVQTVLRVIGRGLRLLGVEAPTRMTERSNHST
ncbi:MAG: arginine--tRNA ligase [Candidatus Binatia bacterium]